jgi:integrase
MPERYIWTEPVLCHYNFDLSKKWFIYFSVTDTISEKTKKVQFRGLINRFKKKDERVLNGNALKSYWKLELKSGWVPFANKDNPIVRPTINEAFSHILEVKASSCSKRTMDSYRHTIGVFTDWLRSTRLEKMKVEQFDAGYARQYMDYLTFKKQYHGRTWNDKLVIMSTFCNCMIDREWIAKNPFRKFKKQPKNIGRNIAFNDHEKRLLKDYFYNHDKPMYYFTQFVHYCFIRRSELTRLKVENIDWKNMTIIIPASASKNKKQESVVIPESFVGILKEMNLESLPSDWYIFGRRMHPGPLQYVNYNHISSRHNFISKKLGIDCSKGLYSWKHAGVCALYYAIKDIYAIMRQCRHSDISTTQIYLKSLGLLDNSAVRSAVW